MTDRVTSGTKHLSLHGDRSVIVTSCGKSMEWTWWQVWQCYRGMEFELSCAHRLWGEMLRENKRYWHRAHSQVILGSGRSTLSVKPNTELRYRKLLNAQFIKVDWHFVAKDWFPQPTNLRTPLFSISDSMSTPLLNISRDGVSLGKGRLTAPSASLGEVTSFPFYSPPSI